MLTIWPCACGPYGGESSAICKRSGAMALPLERPPCNQGDRWQHHCCGLMKEIKITFNKLWLEWAQAPQKVSLSVKLWQLAETGVKHSGPSVHRLISIFSVWLSLNCDLSPVVLSTRARRGRAGCQDYQCYWGGRGGGIQNKMLLMWGNRSGLWLRGIK